MPLTAGLSMDLPIALRIRPLAGERLKADGQTWWLQAEFTLAGPLDFVRKKDF